MKLDLKISKKVNVEIRSFISAEKLHEMLTDDVYELIIEEHSFLEDEILMSDVNIDFVTNGFGDFSGVNVSLDIEYEDEDV